MTAVGGAAPTAGADPEQDKWLDDANESVKKQSFYMKRFLDSSNLREGLKCASAMTGELRTAKLSPKNYYELYMNVTDELRELELFFEDEDNKEAQARAGGGGGGTGQTAGRSIIELYENVQHAGNIIPRLYLLITVASVYIKSKKAPAKDILFDLVELCRGVQHPMRGLFLRNYLSQISRDKLPDAGTEYEGAGGSVKDSIEFILQNFGEMNKLWVRMQHQGAVRDRSRREKERRNLRQLVGTNLVRLSEMSGVDLAMYKEMVLPRILEQVVNCKDIIAQEYLMDCIVNVFPDEFHLATLDTYLNTCTQLQDNVNVKDILITLMNRLSSFAKGGDQADGGHGATNAAKIAADSDMFPLFHKYTSKIIETNPKLTLADTLSLQVALLNFATKIYPNNIGFVDEVLGFSTKVLQRQAGGGKVPRDSVKQVTELLTLPLDALSLAILNLEHYGALLAFLELDQRKFVAVTIISAVVKSRTALDSVEKVDTLFRFIAPVLKDEGEAKPIEDGDKFEFDGEQHLVARMFQLISNEDTDVHYQLYSTARKHFGQGGTQRIEYTLPALVFGSLQLSVRVHAREDAKDAGLTIKTKKLFGFVHETISVLTQHFPEMALRLFLQAAQTADRLDFEAISYEFVVQALLAYEESISDSKAQYAAVNLCVASLQTFSNFGQENYDTLVSKCTQHCAKLLKKTDQCRAVYNCAHLFWPGTDAAPGHRDEKRVLACLQRSLKIANACMGQQVHLFIEILNKYLYFFDRKCPSITVKYLKGLLSLIEEHIRTLDNSESSRIAKTHYENTVAHMKMKTAGADEAASRYQEIESADREASTNLETNES